MDTIMNMNDCERAFAEENVKTIDRFLSYHKLDYDTHYDVVVFGFLKAVMQYLSVERLQQYQFSTIAWRKMDDEVWRYHRDQNRLKRNVVPLSIEPTNHWKTFHFTTSFLTRKAWILRSNARTNKSLNRVCLM